MFVFPVQQGKPSLPQAVHESAMHALPGLQEGSEVKKSWQHGSPALPQPSHVAVPPSPLHRRVGLAEGREFPEGHWSTLLLPAQQGRLSSPQAVHLPVAQTLPEEHEGVLNANCWQHTSAGPPHATHVLPAQARG